LRSSGSPQSVFGLFGGPGFLVVCVLLIGVAGAIAYLGLTGGLGSVGRATTISLPGARVPLAPDGAPAVAGTTAPLQSMPAIPIAKEVAVSVAIEEDLSPVELIAKYPPDPAAALPVGADILPAWQRFGRTSMISLEGRRVALVITGLGRNRIDTVRAITGAPPEASLSFDPDAPNLADWIAAARSYGHEAFLDLPLQETARGDALALAQSPEENLRRLDAMLARAPMIAGVAVTGGEAFLADGAALRPILDRLNAAGLAVVGLPVTGSLIIAADETIARYASQAEIKRSIESVMGLAVRRGAALGLVDSSSAATLFPAWQRALVGRDEISLVPASALVEEWAVASP
jgi:polysaccharide deacetylase 2 family uncharacterized protein YibQ